MPLTLHATSALERDTNIPLPGEMPEQDFNGPHCDWFYESFESNPKATGTSHYNAFKQTLADFFNAHIKGPFWIHESYSQGAEGSFPEELNIVILDSEDRAKFKAEWQGRFKEEPNANAKNLRLIMERAAAGFVHKDPRITAMATALKQDQLKLK